MPQFYDTPDFEASFTYHGNDLGAVWSKEKTAFRLWAPTADAVSISLYSGGDPAVSDPLKQIPMNRDVSGTWTAQVSGNLNGVYYTYQVTRDGQTVESCDPYARAVGVNGHRAMVLDLASTNPEGWEHDTDPHAGSAVTDAVIYEAHVRDVSVHRSSGIRQKGKFLGIVEPGTRVSGHIPTGLDHIKDLGITHLQLLPVFDYGSVDESNLQKPQFNWGYDPVNFNVPEGSYSSDPFDGAVRVREMKQMVKSLHDHGISVVMDVVYNHVFDANRFCFNRIVPDYFSRVNNRVYANGSGCGNDTASERSMVRKYIVDSVSYWADEYHIDGFRFDLSGLLDIQTINETIGQVHKHHPNVIFYGEGWNLPTTTVKTCDLAVQSNAHLTPEFAYFNDTLRDSLRGSVFFAAAKGYVTGSCDFREQLESCFRGLCSWCRSPKQTVNYVSCHDNNTLFDRIALATPNASFEDHVRMNKLAAAFYLTAQGIPFMQAGEEMLRSKPNPKGGYIENSYRSPDSVNSIKWNLLKQQPYRETFAYYKGLIAFRKAHPVLRMVSVYDVLSNLIPIHCLHPQVLAFRATGNVAGEPADELFLMFNAAATAETIPLPGGKWQICINGERAGTQCLATVEGSATLPPISAMVLVKGNLK